MRSEQAAEHLASLDLELQELTDGRRGAAGAADGGPASAGRADAGARAAASGSRRDAAARRRPARARSGLASRIEVLEGLERSHEGLGTGAREVLRAAGTARPGPVADGRRHGRRLPDRAPRVRPADRPGPGRTCPTLPGARRRTAGPGAAAAAAAVLRPRQLPAADARRQPAPADADEAADAGRPSRRRSSAAGASGRRGAGRAGGALRRPGAGRPAAPSCWAGR